MNSWTHPFALGKHYVGKERGTEKIFLICPIVLFPKTSASPHTRCSCGPCMHHEYETHITSFGAQPRLLWETQKWKAELCFGSYLCAISLVKWTNQWTLALQSAILPHRETMWTMSSDKGINHFWWLRAALSVTPWLTTQDVQRCPQAPREQNQAQTHRYSQPHTVTCKTSVKTADEQNHCDSVWEEQMSWHQKQAEHGTGTHPPCQLQSFCDFTQVKEERTNLKVSKKCEEHDHGHKLSWPRGKKEQRN